jgi:hypothetical protein
MEKALQALVTLFGIVCVLIALAHILFGSAIVPAGVKLNPTTDSEDRFYAAMFMGFGAALIWCSRDLHVRAQAFNALMLVFFIGGIARVVSALQLGLPHPLFSFLGALELVLPPLLWWWRRRAFH